jgi:hypothetical protein
MRGKTCNLPDAELRELDGRLVVRRRPLNLTYSATNGIILCIDRARLKFTDNVLWMRASVKFVLGIVWDHTVE